MPAVHLTLTLTPTVTATPTITPNGTLTRQQTQYISLAGFEYDSLLLFRFSSLHILRIPSPLLFYFIFLACIVGLVWGSNGVAVIAKIVVVTAATKMSSAASRMGVSSGVSSDSNVKVHPSSLSSGVERSSAPSSTSY
jgi:hypothetical protein